MQPLGEPVVLLGAGAGFNGVLEGFGGGLVHAEVEEADAVVDVSAFCVFFRNP